MKISEAIERLTELMAEAGDVEVTRFSGIYVPAAIELVNVVPCGTWWQSLPEGNTEEIVSIF